MRRILLLAVGVLTLALAVPSIASAHGHHHRHGHHHAKAHHARVEQFHGSMNTDPAGPAGPGDAGTVQSFDSGVLTITLADGSVVRGNVTSDTEINCMGPSAQASRDGGSGDSSSGDGQGDQNTQAGDQQGGDQGDQEDQNQGGEDQGDQQGQAPTCDTTSLTPGTPVHEAILKIGSTGATFKLVVLDQPQQQAGS